ncbi:hypothetical protein ACU686_24235 [Yinghuangia aomiensis]
MSNERSKRAKVAMQEADKRELEIGSAVLRGAAVRGFRGVSPSQSARTGQAARDDANKAVGLEQTRGLSAAAKKRWRIGLEYVQGT